MKKKIYNVHYIMNGYQCVKKNVRAHSKIEAENIVGSFCKLYPQAILIKDPNKQ